MAVLLATSEIAAAVRKIVARFIRILPIVNLGQQAFAKTLNNNALNHDLSDFIVTAVTADFA